MKAVPRILRVPKLWVPESVYAAIKPVAVALAVLAMSASLWPERLDAALQRTYSGHADAAAYALQARSLHRGQGLHIPYVTNFFYVYDRDIWRHDDHWPPLLSFALAAVYPFTGESVPISHAIASGISTFLVPLSVALLAMAASRRCWPGLVTPLPFLLSENLMLGGMSVMSDQVVMCAAALFLASLLASRYHPAWLLFAGGFMALAWYGKGSQILLAPMLLVGVFVIHGPKALILRWHLGAWLIALLILFPRLNYNVDTHGKPFVSTQSPVAAFYGMTRGT